MFHTHRGRVKQQFNIHSDVPHTGGKMTKTTPTSTGGRGGETTPTAGTTTGGGGTMTMGGRGGGSLET